MGWGRLISALEQFPVYKTGMKSGEWTVLTLVRGNAYTEDGEPLSSVQEGVATDALTIYFMPGDSFALNVGNGIWIPKKRRIPYYDYPQNLLDFFDRKPNFYIWSAEEKSDCVEVKVRRIGS
jgi:hypothetical protein